MFLFKISALIFLKKDIASASITIGFLKFFTIISKIFAFSSFLPNPHPIAIASKLLILSIISSIYLKVKQPLLSSEIGKTIFSTAFICKISEIELGQIL